MKKSIKIIVIAILMVSITTVAYKQGKVDSRNERLMYDLGQDLDLTQM